MDTDEAMKYLRAESVSQAIREVLGVDWQLLTGRNRVSSVSSARVMCGAMLRERTRMSLEEIGTYLGNRDHSTVMYYVEKCQRDMRQNLAIAATYRKVAEVAERIEDTEPISAAE